MPYIFAFANALWQGFPKRGRRFLDAFGKPSKLFD
jgi:hypothetical protein